MNVLFKILNCHMVYRCNEVDKELVRKLMSGNAREDNLVIVGNRHPLFHTLYNVGIKVFCCFFS